jgi:glycosyl transferase family 25
MLGAVLLWALTTTEGFEPETSVHYYVIHMPSNTTRAANIAQQEEKLGAHIERFDAVVGKDVTDVTTIDPALRNTVGLTQGELGCYLSHYQLIKRIAAGSATYGCVFEDDFDLVDGIDHSFIESAVKYLDGTDVDMLFLGAMNDNEADAPSDRRITQSNVVYEVRDYKPATWMGTHGYIVAQKSATKIQEFLKDMAYPIDYAFYVAIQRDFLKAMVVTPNVIFQDKSHVGTIAHEIGIKLTR